MSDVGAATWRGLTTAEVAARTAGGKVNRADDRSSRTLAEIVQANVVTRFNAVIAALMAVALALGEWRDALFGFVMILNLAIGVVQEWRAKTTLDRLSLITAPRVVVWRDGTRREVASDEVVIDEVFELAPGDQIVVDGIVLHSDGLSVDESLLTGESASVDKWDSEDVKSGSFVTAGGGVARASAVGADSYAARLTAEARHFRAPKSETAKGIDRILGFVSWAIVPAGVMLYFGQRASDDEATRDTLLGVVAGVVALVPQGLVLLLSMAQTVAVIRLGRRHVLVQRLQAVESLARVTVLAREHVRPKVISGDNPITVAAIAKRCHVPDADRYVDARELPDEPAALAAVADATAVFGRVTPEAKRALLHALQGRGEVVAMTGDGVNDTLALKDADLGIAMGAGTPAAKAVSDIVLLDNRFATLPGVVAEGRRVIANIERVARLFLTKTVWAAVLALLTGVLLTRYPLRPRHLTVVDALTIGIPGFVLSFQPSHDPVRPGFIRRVLRFSIPAGLISGLATMAVYQVGVRPLDLSIADAQSGATLTLVAVGLWVLYELARPLDTVRAALVVGLVVMAIGAFTIPFVADFFLLEIPPAEYALWIAAIVTTACVLIHVALPVVEKADLRPWPRSPTDVTVKA